MEGEPTIEALAEEYLAALLESRHLGTKVDVLRERLRRAMADNGLQAVNTGAGAVEVVPSSRAEWDTAFLMGRLSTDELKRARRVSRFAVLKAYPRRVRGAETASAENGREDAPERAEEGDVVAEP